MYLFEFLGNCFENFVWGGFFLPNGVWKLKNKWVENFIGYFFFRKLIFWGENVGPNFWGSKNIGAKADLGTKNIVDFFWWWGVICV